MKTTLSPFLLIIFLLKFAFTDAQTLSAPEAEGVYGGQILDIESWSFDPDSVYVVISTESPNSIFVAKALRNSNRNDLSFSVLPSAGSDDGYGDNVENIEVHEFSNTLYFLVNSSVYKTNLTSSSATLVDQLVKNFIIKGDTMCLVKNNRVAGGLDTLVFGPIDATGNFSPTNGFSLLKRFNDPPQLLISPYDNQLNLFERGTSAQRQYVSDAFHSMTNSSSIASALSAAPILPNVDWRTTGIASNGDLYVVGQPPLGTPTITDRTIAWSDDNGFTWQHSLMNGPGPAGGSVGNNLVIDELGGQRHLYCGNLFLRDTAIMGTWHNPGKLKINDLNRANDGKTLADPLVQDIKYHSTNVGFGYSVDAGDSIYGWNEGIEAVQINDIDMNNDFSIGWVASKSGVRKVENYDTPSELWHPTYFPNLDGSPYLSVAVDSGDNDVVFVGNIRVYRTTNGGTITGSGDGWEEVFTPEQSPYSFNRINTKCNTIAISELNDQVIMAGFSQDYSNKGGVFYSLDQGASWMQLLLNVSTTGEDLDINDIEMVEESGNVVAYIGVEADASTSGAYGVYRAELSSGVWTVSHETVFGSTDHAVDLELNTTRDTLIVLYTDPFSLFTNNVLLKDLSTGTWGSNHPGPLSNNSSGSAITIGDNYLFLAIEEQIYTCPISSIFSWSLAYSYPVGMHINVLFYDELLVGTSTGLYAHTLEFNAVGTQDKVLKNKTLAYYDPVSDLIKVKADVVIKELSIFNVSGSTVLHAYPESATFDLNLFANPGVYVLRATPYDGPVVYQKLIVYEP